MKDLKIGVKFQCPRDCAIDFMVADSVRALTVKNDRGDCEFLTLIKSITQALE